MKFRMVITTIDEGEIEAPSLADAQRRAADLESGVNQRHHFGEKTTIRVVAGEQLADEGTPA